jgi:hypothetical protein
VYVRFCVVCMGKRDARACARGRACWDAWGRGRWVGGARARRGAADGGTEESGAGAAGVTRLPQKCHDACGCGAARRPGVHALPAARAARGGGARGAGASVRGAARAARRRAEALRRRGAEASAACAGSNRQRPHAAADARARACDRQRGSSTRPQRAARPRRELRGAARRAGRRNMPPRPALQAHTRGLDRRAAEAGAPAARGRVATRLLPVLQPHVAGQLVQPFCAARRRARQRQLCVRATKNNNATRRVPCVSALRAAGARALAQPAAPRAPHLPRRPAAAAGTRRTRPRAWRPNTLHSTCRRCGAAQPQTPPRRRPARRRAPAPPAPPARHPAARTQRAARPAAAAAAAHSSHHAHFRHSRFHFHFLRRHPLLLVLDTSAPTQSSSGHRTAQCPAARRSPRAERRRWPPWEREGAICFEGLR